MSADADLLAAGTNRGRTDRDASVMATPASTPKYRGLDSGLHDVSHVVAVSVIGWVPRVELRPNQWLELGRRLGRVGAGANWWIGDWLCYGAARYGERYKLASRLTGYDRQTLMNYAYVATHVDISRRRQDVSWSHHAEIAARDSAEQSAWLDRIARDHLSLADLRLELRSHRVRVRDPATSLPRAIIARCPVCGSPLPRPTGTSAGKSMRA
jgi:hypothetical protein